jgi:DNA-directed RNA polymerase subunit omega
MRDDCFQEALEIVGDPYILVNMIWERMQMLRRGNHRLIESVDKLPLEDVALREIIDGRIAYVQGKMVVPEELGMQERAIDNPSNASTSPFVGTPCNAGATT